MDEAEINDWYEEQKLKAEEEFVKDLQDKKDHDVSEKRYSKKLKDILDKYNKLMEKNIKKQEFNRKVKD